MENQQFEQLYNEYELPYIVQSYNEVKTDLKNCSICFIEFADKELVKTNCNHIYHYACLKKWVFEFDNESCPLCRHNVMFNYDDETSYDDESTDYNDDSTSYDDESSEDEQVNDDYLKKHMIIRDDDINGVTCINGNPIHDFVGTYDNLFNSEGFLDLEDDNILIYYEHNRSYYIFRLSIISECLYFKSYINKIYLEYMKRKLIIKICSKCKVKLTDKNNIIVFSICDECHKNRKIIIPSNVNFMPFLKHLI